MLRRLLLVGSDRVCKMRAEERNALTEEFRESLDTNHLAFRGTLLGSR